MYREAGQGAGRGEAHGKTDRSRAAEACTGKCGGLGPCAVDTAHELAESLGRAVDARDKRLFQHSAVVADLATLLARAHGLTARQAQLVHMAGHLHDVGKIGIPDHILHKPGPLNADEWAVMRRHPQIGAEILRPVRVFRGRPGVCEIVLAHHERFDGSGYPRGLRGGEIPLGARIVAVADALSAMTEERPYRNSLTPEEAMEEVLRGAGTLFDPFVVRDLLPLRALFAELLVPAGATCPSAGGLCPPVARRPGEMAAWRDADATPTS